MTQKYFPITGDSQKPAKGFEPVDLKDWLEIDSTNEKRLLLKEKIFRENKHQALKITPGSEEACFELEQMVRDHVLQYFPDQFSMAASELYVNSTGYSFSQAQNAEQALMNVAQYVQEDFALFDSEKLIASVNCFSRSALEKPSEWVSGELGQKVAWIFQENDQVVSGNVKSGEAFVRVERQTQRLLPKTKKVLLTVRTYIYPAK